MPVQADCRRAEDCKRVGRDRRCRAGAASTSWSTTMAPRRSASIMTLDDAAWQKAIEQNLMYVVRMAREAVPHMIAARRRQRRQHHRAIGDPALCRLRPVGRELGRRDRLCQDAVDRACAVRNQRQHHLPRLHRHHAAGEGVRGRRRRTRTRCAAKLDRADPDGPHRHRRRRREPGRAAGVGPRQLHHRAPPSRSTAACCSMCVEVDP